MKFLVSSLNAAASVRDRGPTFPAPTCDLLIFFDDLRIVSQKHGAHFLALGLKRGDRVAIVLPEGEHFIPAFLGALWVGLIPVPLYPPLSLGKLDAFMEALVTILNVARPRA